MDRRERLALLVAQAKATVEKAEAEERALTPDERQEIDDLTAQAKNLASTMKAGDKVARLTKELGSPGGSDLHGALKSAGFPHGRAVVDAYALKAPTFTGDTDDLSPLRREGFGLGLDDSYLADTFPSQNTGSATSVQVLRQTGRLVTGTVSRDPFATTAKAEAATTREMVTASVGQLAVMESDIPNAMLSADTALRGVINADLRIHILEAKDDAVAAAVAAATPAPAGTPGDLARGILEAAADMLSVDGYRGRTVAIGPGDFTEFQLLRGDEEKFARTDPLAGFRFVVSKSVADGSPLLIAPEAGRRYEGNVSAETFEMNDGETNTSRIRMEQLFLMHIERPGALRIIGGGS